MKVAKENDCSLQSINLGGNASISAEGEFNF
jgi:hypothetical protein